MYSIYDHHQPGMYMTTTANNSGIAQDFVGPCPEGYQWYVERATTFSNTAKTTGLLVELFVLSSEKLSSDWTQTVGSRQGRQDVTNAVNAASDNSSPVVVPAGYYLVALWSGFTSGDRVELSLQVAVHQLVPVIGTPMDAAAESLSHLSAREHVELSHEVTGSLAV